MWPLGSKRRTRPAFLRRTRYRHRSNRYGTAFQNSRLQSLRRDRWRTRFRVLITALLALGSAAALAWLVYLVAFSKTLTVQQLEVVLPQRARTVTQEQVENALVPLIGTHMARIDPVAVEQQILRELPRLRSAEVKKLPPGTLQVTAWEYQRYGIVRQPLTGMGYTVNEAGRVIARTAEPQDSDVQFLVLTTEPYGLDQVIIAPEHLTYLRAFFADIVATKAWSPDRITYDPLAEEAKIKVARGPELWITFSKDEKSTLLDLTQALATPQLRDHSILYIDLRLPNGHVVYKLG